MCVLRISFTVYMSAVQKLAMDLYLAVKDIPGTCSPINSLTKTIISKQRVVWQLIEERNGRVLGIYGRVCEWEQYKGTEIAMVTYLVLNTLQSAVQENLSETVSVKICRGCTEVQYFCCFGCMVPGKCLPHSPCECFTSPSLLFFEQSPAFTSPSLFFTYKTSCTSVASPHNCNNTICLACI